MSRGWLIGWVWLFGVVALGCAAKSNKGTISGNVTLDGQPLKSGVIQFEPADRKTSPADGVITDGKYNVRVAPGEMNISISAPKVTGKRRAYDTPDSPMVDTVVELLPERYNRQTELKFTVAVGPQQKDFELKSGK